MMSLVAIAKQLTKMGISTPSKGKSRRQVKNTGWSGEVIWQILVSETYSGTWRYGKYIARGGKGGKRPIDEQIAVNVPAIVSREMWELAQARRAYNSRIAKRKMKREYLLRGLIYCGCGRGMVGGGRHNEGFYYRCPRRYASGVAAGSELCNEPLVKSELIECVAWDYILGLITNPEQFEQKLRQAQAQEAATMQPKQKELDHLQALLRGTEKEAEEIAREIPKTKGIIRAKLEQQGEEVNRRYQALTKHKVKLQEALAIELTERNIDNLLEFRKAVAVGLGNPTFEDKRRWLEILQTKVKVTSGIAVVTCRLGGNPLEYRLFELDTSISLT